MCSHDLSNIRCNVLRRSVEYTDISTRWCDRPFPILPEALDVSPASLIGLEEEPWGLMLSGRRLDLFRNFSLEAFSLSLLAIRECCQLCCQALI